MSKLAAAAYAAYCVAVGGKTFDDRPLPTFDELGERQKAGWHAAATSTVPGVELGGAITTRDGLQGTVRSIAADRFGQTGVWMEAIDSTGRPFEHYVHSDDILPPAQKQLALEA